MPSNFCGFHDLPPLPAEPDVTFGRLDHLMEKKIVPSNEINH